MNQHTDERDAFEYVVKQIPNFEDWWLTKSDEKYVDSTTNFGWMMWVKRALMSAQGVLND